MTLWLLNETYGADGVRSWRASLGRARVVVVVVVRALLRKHSETLRVLPGGWETLELLATLEVLCCASLKKCLDVSKPTWREK